MSNQESNRIRQIVGWGIVGLIAVIGVSIVLSLYFVPRSPGAFYYPFFPFHFGWLGGIFLIFIIFWVARWLFWPWRGGYYSYPHRQRADPASIVRERYAKGEITKEQFEQIMRDLRQDGG
jgi:putative membrane protein